MDGGPDITTAPVRAWRSQIGCPLGGRTPVIGRGILVVGCDDPRLFALDARTGLPRWAVDLENPVLGAVTIDGTRVLVSTLTNVEARSLDDGALVWSKPIPGAYQPLVANGTFFAATKDGWLYGLDVEDGSTDFEYNAGAEAGGSAAEGNSLFVNVVGGSFRAVDPATGQALWSHQVRSTDVSSPAIGAKLAYVAALVEGPDSKGELYAIDRTTGEVRWTQRTTSGRQLGPPIVDGDTVYAGSEDEGVFAYDAATGTERWNAPAGVMYLPVATTGSVVYAVGNNAATASDAVWAFSATDGTPLWTLDLEARGANSPVVSGGMLFVGEAAGHIDAYAEPAIAERVADLVAAAAAPTPTAMATAAATPEPLQALFGEPVRVDMAALGLGRPGGMDVGPDGNLYLVNLGQAEVVVLSPKGEVVDRWGSRGSGDGQFDFQRVEGDPFSSIGGVGVAPDGRSMSLTRRTGESSPSRPMERSSANGAGSAPTTASSSTRSTSMSPPMGRCSSSTTNATTSNGSSPTAPSSGRSPRAARGRANSTTPARSTSATTARSTAPTGATTGSRRSTWREHRCGSSAGRATPPAASASRGTSPSAPAVSCSR